MARHVSTQGVGIREQVDREIPGAEEPWDRAQRALTLGTIRIVGAVTAMEPRQWFHLPTPSKRNKRLRA